MGGGGHGGYHPVKTDPAVESWSYMRENVWKTFRFTNRTSRLAVVWGLLVPLGVYYVAQRQDLKWDFQAAKRDDPLARFGSYAQKPSERAAAAQAGADEDEE